MDSVTGPLAARVLGSGLKSMPAATTLTGPYNGPGTGTGELTNLITELCATSACSTAARVQAVTAAACDRLRQRQHVDQLSIGRGLQFMSKKSKVPDLNEPFRHQDHPRPRTRREFVAQGFMTGAATVIAPTLAGMLAYPRAARASLATDIQTAVANCNITTGAGKIPFICFDLAGGGNIAGSNVLVGGPPGELDFPSVRGASNPGLP